MNRIKISDLTDYRYLSEVTASPSGKQAAFLVKQADRKKKGYDSWIYIVDFCTEEVRKLTSFGAENHIVFDGEDTILFSSRRKPEDEGEKHEKKTVFYRISLKGGEAERAFELPYDVEEIRKAGPGIYCFAATVDLNRPQDKEELEEYRDYHILEELPYWANGAYFVSRFRRTLFVFDEAEGSCGRVTEPLFAAEKFEVCKNKLFYTGISYDQCLPKSNGLFCYDLEKKEQTCLAGEGNGAGRGECRFGEEVPASMGIGFFGCRTEGQSGEVQVVFAACPVDGADGRKNPDFYVWRDGSVSREASFGYSVGSAPAGDTSLGGGRRFLTQGGKTWFISCRRTKGKIHLLEAGKIRELVDFDGTADFFDRAEGGLVFVGRTPRGLQELYFYDEERGQCRQLTCLNEAALEGRYVGAMEDAGFVNSDGVDIDGWVILPKDYDPAKKYPAVLDIHGGPKVAYGDVFFHEMQVLAGAGYFVLQCNPRGGDGRGDGFADLREKYGTIDYQDLMEFTDHVCRLYPAIDQKRLGVTGGSYGGFMTNWIIGHTDRFAAAVSQRSFSNFLSDFGCSEIGYSFDVEENGGKTPWTAPEELWKRSPVAYACNAKTPTLFIHSLKDYNCPLSEGMQMFAALKYFGVPSRAFLFEGENHELSRSGKPLHRIRRLEEMLGWFDRYLKEEDGEREHREKGDEESW